MYDFIKNMWIMRKYTESNIEKCVSKGYITQDQAIEIMSFEKIEVIS